MLIIEIINLFQISVDHFCLNFKKLIIYFVIIDKRLKHLLVLAVCLLF